MTGTASSGSSSGSSGATASAGRSSSCPSSDDPEIRELNQTYRKKDKSTDVLSFPLNEKGSDGRFYLGDIVISVPRAREQAAELGHPLDRELEILAVHGFLHLLGYEHDAGHEDEEAELHALYLGKG